MYLNEKAWEVPQDNLYLIDRAIKDFLNIYASIKRKNPRREIFVPEGETIYLRLCPLEKWLAYTDIEYRRLWLSFYQRRIQYHPEDEYEMLFGGEVLKAGTEACLNDSFVISVCLEDKWKTEKIRGELYSLGSDEIREVSVDNVYKAEQLDDSSIKQIVEDREAICVNTYEDLWERRSELFPYLEFCPSVKDNLENLERLYLSQVLKKLMELDGYINKYGTRRFNPNLLTKTTTESERTLKEYGKQHMFKDADGVPYVANWHMRFTGIPGRIFFIPEYRENKMLVCYIGKKLPNVTYST